MTGGLPARWRILMQFRLFLAVLLPFSLGALAGCPLGNDPSTDFRDVIPPSGDKAAPGHDNNVTPESGNDPIPGLTSAEEPGITAPDEPKSALVPAYLQGQWKTILTYVPGYYTGDVPVADFNGSIGVTYYFGADGQYQYDLNSAMA